MSEAHEQPESVRDTINAAVEEHTEEPQLDLPDVEVSAVAEEPVIEEPAAETVEVEEVEHQPEAVEADAEAAETVEEKASEAVDEKPAEEQEPEEVILAPASWSNEDRKAWDKLDSEAKAIVARRETERDRITMDAARELAPLKSVMQEHGEHFRQIGMAPDLAIREYVETEKILRYGTPAQKQEAISAIARNYGIDMPAVSPGQPQTEEWVDPDITRIENTINERFGTIEQALASRQREVEVAENRKAQETSETFIQGLQSEDPAKAPEVRYVEEAWPVFNTMVEAELARAGTPNVDRLRQLYSDAAWATPGVRDKMQTDLEALKPKRVVKTVETQSTSISGGTGRAAHSEEPPKEESVRDSIRRAQDEVERQLSGR